MIVHYRAEQFKTQNLQGTIFFCLCLNSLYSGFLEAKISYHFEYAGLKLKKYQEEGDKQIKY